MDPNATLQTLRDFAERYADGCPDVNHVDCDHADQLTEIAEAVNALDVWISRGGFLPSDWQRR
jgi:hypothetical protein